MEFNQREAILLSTLCSVTILLTGYSALIKPQFKTLEETSSRLSESSKAVEELEASQMELTQNVGRAKAKNDENKQALLFTFEDKNLETRMKGFMRVLSSIATETGNQLITIQPYVGDDEKGANQAIEATDSEEKKKELPEELQRFQAIKEPDLPLYSAKMELKIRGNFDHVKKFIETLATFKKELVKVETMYLSYEGLNERVMSQFDDQDSGNKKSDPARHLSRPLLLVTRLKFYLMEPNENKFKEAVEEIKAKEEAEKEVETEEDS